MNKNIETNVVKPSLAIHQNDTEYRLLSTESEVSLDSKIKAIEDLMLNNSGKGKTEEEKDKLYSDAQILWKDYYDELVKTKYTFFLTRKQYQFLTETLRDKIEYDVNTLFFAIELTDMLGNWIKEQGAKNNGYSQKRNEQNRKPFNQQQPKKEKEVDGDLQAKLAKLKGMFK